jgi:hypothetical protein
MAATENDRREHGADPVHLIAEQGGGLEGVRIGVLDGGHDQIAEKLDIDRKYYRKMLAEEPGLLAANVNRWLFRAPQDKRLMRMVKPIALGERAKGIEAAGAQFALRAYLSNGYKVIDHYSVLRVLVPELAERHARTEEFNLSEQRFNVRVVTPELDVFEGKRQVGEMVAFGVAIRNSETGHSAASVEAFARILRCFNGMVVDEAFRINHVSGKRHDASESWMSDDTKRLTDATDILKIRDRIRHTFSPEVRSRVAGQIAAAAGEPLQLAAGQSVLEFVSNVGIRYDLSKGEAEALKDTVMEELAQSNTKPSEATRFTVAQAFTALGRNVGRGNGEAGNFERKVELERIGWKVLSDPLDALLRAGKARNN